MTWTPAHGSTTGYHRQPLCVAVFTECLERARERLRRDLAELERRTVDFVATVVDSDLPRPRGRRGAQQSQHAAQPDLFSDPGWASLFGWEGVHDRRGSCHGSCTHVWNYEHVTAQLFPSLARGMREVEFLHLTKDDGGMSFRASLPLGRAATWSGSAADGQLGCSGQAVARMAALR